MAYALVLTASQAAALARAEALSAELAELVTALRDARTGPGPVHEVAETLPPGELRAAFAAAAAARSRRRPRDLLG